MQPISWAQICSSTSGAIKIMVDLLYMIHFSGLLLISTINVSDCRDSDLFRLKRVELFKIC